MDGAHRWRRCLAAKEDSCEEKSSQERGKCDDLFADAVKNFSSYNETAIFDCYSVALNSRKDCVDLNWLSN